MTTGALVVVVTTGSLSVVVVVGLGFLVGSAAGFDVVVVRLGACVAVVVGAFTVGDVVRSLSGVCFFFAALAGPEVEVEVLGCEEEVEVGADEDVVVGAAGVGAGADSSACDAAAKPMTTVAAMPATASPEVTAAAVRCAV